ncbi:N-acetylneuraminic acid synthase isoform X2 [Rhodnius prolixus]|uniref:N-acetylneuraminic acid synthase isoform X2 n=1 Tax=Rhodnius prolixus TaxID=13249 RepID=UPI003D188B8F
MHIESGADCVKFQKSCLYEKFTKQALEAPYKNKNSWGQTYGDHKKHLEFSEDQYLILQKYAEEMGILFTASAMDPISLDFLLSLSVPFIKIGSGDADNILLIEKAAATQVPLIISTGMQTMESVENIYNLVKKFHSQFALLHCISAYPTPSTEANINVITKFRERFSDIVIGYSGHEENYNITLAAVALGAKIVERHITLDNSWKGNDHKCSLTPNNFKNMVDSIREIEGALGNGIKQIQPCEIDCYNKLGKCVVAAKFLPKGHTLKSTDIKVKVARLKGITPSNIYKVLKKKLKHNLDEDQVINAEDLET